MGELIRKGDFASIMKDNIEIYAKEVNEDRAIPSAIDSLKPVQRRILYWLFANKGANKMLGCAQIVGGVLGAYHPHGDSSVYGALVRMSQPLIMSYPLIDFDGNNGSLTDPPAAMRYTKAKLSYIGCQLLNDLSIPNMVPWQNNYDDTLQEPKYLLGELGPLGLLLNPQLGIGVGLASNFTCHNIEDIKRVVEYRIAHPNCSFEDLPPLYPSFHNGGILVNSEEVPAIYRTGRGTIVLRAKVEYVKDKHMIHVIELPYRVDATSIKKTLIKSPIPGISEVYEDKGKLKIYLEKGVDYLEIEKLLYKKTNLECNYAINMMATDKAGKPRLWNLLEIIDLYIIMQHHRINTKATYEKSEAEKKLHIQQGLSAALSIIDEVIEIIRKSESEISAKESLKKRLSIDDEQAAAILNIRLGKLSRMSINEVENFIHKLEDEIKTQEKILNEKELRENMMKESLSTYSDKSEKTPVLRLIKRGVDGEKVSQTAYIEIFSDCYRCSYNEHLKHDLMIEPTKEYIIFTTGGRAIKYKGSDFEIGEKGVSQLRNGEQILFIDSVDNLSKDGYVLLNDTRRLDTRIIILMATPRGKKVLNNMKEPIESYQFLIDK